MSEINNDTIQLFKNWIEEQSVFEDVSISFMEEHLSEELLNNLLSMYQKRYNALQTMVGLLGPKQVRDVFGQNLVLSEEKIKVECSHLYSLLDNDIPGLISYLIKNNFSSEEIDEEEEATDDVNEIVKKYHSFFELLFDCGDEDEQERFLFAVANRFFEFCFSSKTFPLFKAMLVKSSRHPIIRLLYAVMWRNLAEHGWQHWHKNCLDAIKKEADLGKEIVYIAGGTDIYQLIKHGVYNIRVIDPLLSSQPNYYSDHWEWFIKRDTYNHGIGERAIVPDTDFVMKRVDYFETGKSCCLNLSNDKMETISESITTWEIYDTFGFKKGSIIFERRLAASQDFVPVSDKALIMSYNELYFVAAPKEHGGWGIDVRVLQDDLVIFVKQLRLPVSKKNLCNMRYEAEQEDFGFIHLGTCTK